MEGTRSRRFAALIAGASLAVVLSACSGGNGSSDNGVANDGTPKLGGSLTFALEEESPGYNPGISGSLAYSGSHVWLAVHDTLAAYTDDGDIAPRLAESIEPNDDFTVWTVKLRSGLKYSSGKDVTTEDVARVFADYYVAEDSSMRSTFASIASVKAIDDTTVEFTTTSSYASFPAVLTQYYVFNPDVKEKYGDQFGAHPDGTGPFRLVSWQRDSQIELEANPNYWRKDDEGRQLPYLKNLTLRIIPSGPTRTATLESGGISGFQSVQPSILQQATGINDITVEVNSMGGFGWFLNTQSAPTDDIRVRTALAHGMDRNVIVAAQGADEILTPLDQYYGESNPYFSQSASDAYPDFDAASAQELVDEYVNDPSRSDGESVGEPIKLQVNYIAGDEQSTSAVQVVEQQWGDVGIEVEPNALDSAAWVQAALEGNTQAFWFGWSGTDPAYNYTRTYSDPEVSPTNWTKLDDPELRDMIADLRACPDLECGVEENDVIANRMVEQMPVLPIQAVSNGVVYDSSKIGGLHFLPGAEAGFVTALDWATMWAK